MKRIAVIDVGSNSIKCLVARRHPTGGLVTLYENTLAVRISAGIGAAQPTLEHSALDAGSEAVAQLVSECERKGPIEDTRIVATSAVRDASNGNDFLRLVYDRTGIEATILSGEDEARLIGRGVIEDPALQEVGSPYSVADLGGGSLEIIRVSGGAIEQSLSLPLGTVRLTERFIRDPRAPLDVETRKAMTAHIEEVIRASGCHLSPIIVGTGGVVTVWRSMVAQQRGLALPEISPDLPRDSLREWIDRFAQMGWEERRAIPGLPISRTDIIPAGFVIIDAVLGLAGSDQATHSRFNLRYGVAAEALDALDRASIPNA